MMHQLPERLLMAGFSAIATLSAPIAATSPEMPPMPAFAHFGVYAGASGFAAGFSAIVSQLDHDDEGPKTKPAMSLAATGLGALVGGGVGMYFLESSGPNVALGWAIGAGALISLALHGRDVIKLVKQIKEVFWPK